MHVIFTADGIPAHISTDPRPGSEWVDVPEGWAADPIRFLASHRRTPKGEWVLREPIVPPEPSPEEIATRQAERDRAYAEALAARAEDIEHELVRRTGSDQLLRLGGKITIAEFNARLTAKRAEIEAQFPMPEPFA